MLLSSVQWPGYVACHIDVLEWVFFVSDTRPPKTLNKRYEPFILYHTLCEVRKMVHTNRETQDDHVNVVLYASSLQDLLPQQQKRISTRISHLRQMGAAVTIISDANVTLDDVAEWQPSAVATPTETGYDLSHVHLNGHGPELKKIGQSSTPVPEPVIGPYNFIERDGGYEGLRSLLNEARKYQSHARPGYLNSK